MDCPQDFGARLTRRGEEHAFESEDATRYSARWDAKLNRAELPECPISEASGSISAGMDPSQCSGFVAVTLYVEGAYFSSDIQSAGTAHM